MKKKKYDSVEEFFAEEDPPEIKAKVEKDFIRIQNEMIAEFMGVASVAHPYYNGETTWYFPKNQPPVFTHSGYYFTSEEIQVCMFKAKDLQYHTSWDWLMPCIQKILELEEVTENMELFFQIRDNIPDIESTYKDVVEFIQWYNSQVKPD